MLGAVLGVVLGVVLGAVVYLLWHHVWLGVVLVVVHQVRLSEGCAITQLVGGQTNSWPSTLHGMAAAAGP